MFSFKKKDTSKAVADTSVPHALTPIFGRLGLICPTEGVLERTLIKMHCGKDISGVYEFYETSLPIPPDILAGENLRAFTSALCKAVCDLKMLRERDLHAQLRAIATDPTYRVKAPFDSAVSQLFWPLEVDLFGKDRLLASIGIDFLTVKRSNVCLVSDLPSVVVFTDNHYAEFSSPENGDIWAEIVGNEVVIRAAKTRLTFNPEAVFVVDAPNVEGES